MRTAARDFSVPQVNLRRPASALVECQGQSSTEPTGRRSYRTGFSKRVRSYERTCVPAWQTQPTNSGHGLPDGHLHGACLLVGGASKRERCSGCADREGYHASRPFAPPLQSHANPQRVHNYMPNPPYLPEGPTPLSPLVTSRSLRFALTALLELEGVM